MNLVEEAFNKLYPENEGNFDFSLKYSGRFNPYNANVRRWGNRLVFNLSREWKKINPEIKIGLLQSLMVKIFKEKGTTINIDFYNNFIRKIDLITPKTKVEPDLEESFERVNQKYFDGLIEKTNLVWGGNSLRKLGSYDLHSDTISVSTIFRKADIRFLDYVMYHEMLHKKHKFYHKGGRNYFHTRKFKEAEKKFEDAVILERELTSFLRKAKKKDYFWKFLGF